MYLEIIIGICISYFILYLISIYLKDNSIVDIFWGIGFLQITIHSFYLSNTMYLSQFLLLLVVSIWSLRISSHIFMKWKKRGIEDSRYLKWRKTWKFFHIRSFFQVFVLQGFLLILVATAIIQFNSNPTLLNSIFYVGFIVSLIGLIYESIADLQLKKFISNKNNKGKILINGLWKFSRHPNYFGESIFWFGVSLIAIISSFYSIVSFLLISFLLRYVSGVPMAEKNYLLRDDFKKYAKLTPPIIPKICLIKNEIYKPNK